MVKLKSSLRKFYGRHHELVDRYRISVSQMIQPHVVTIPSPFPKCDLPKWNHYRVCISMNNTTGAICGSGSWEHPQFFVGLVLLVEVFSFLCCVLCTFICLFVFFFFRHGVVSLFSIYEFEFSSGIFHPPFIF